MLTWCSRAVNFSFPSFLAASRTRSSPLGLVSRLGVRPRLGCRVFSLVCDLPSTTSAGDESLLFGCFVGTTSLYDSPLPFVMDLPLIAFSFRPTLLHAGQPWGLPVLAHEVSLHAWGLRLRGTAAHSRCRAQPCCLLVGRHHGLPETRDFGAQYPSLQIPLSNASSAALRLLSHGSGPRWFAIPSLYDSLIRYFVPVYPGAVRPCRRDPIGHPDASVPRRLRLHGSGPRR